MDIERQKLIEECAHNYILDDYAGTAGQKIYQWEDWDSLDDDGGVIVINSMFPPVFLQPYTFFEVGEVDIQNSYIVEEDEEEERYYVAVSIEEDRTVGKSTDEMSARQEKHYETLHVLVEYRENKFIACEVDY
ncbi:hypothetical protein [Nodularia sphaerocarpa]|uniref:hypothetical protein n=1 Tax=Nodularia sphaerocarpa TaxID=137816 RepID=UPI001EFB4285|nr:hypothetical protein [Nodularia sphaerocarpa]MDB9372784.1 hypothetical protein [Nodularia sphaerocarpa CS-585]MDB9379524.1 hypothetical protein [Nodularia sphaerocarpa CS-585A2]ULP74172.1 hypothetical protein BDGGKGIB_03835 [Nodularia sphaerocarpa UHCC 0038]